MIYITKGQMNEICLTLKESSAIASPYYLFVFENEYDTTDDPILWQPTDLSMYTDRYNLFELEEGVDLTLPTGQYTYKVYESSDVPTSVSDTSGDIIEEGRMVVELSYITSTIYD